MRTREPCLDPRVPRTVLLVGGASSYRRAIRDVMRLEGVATIESESAPAAIALLKEAAFDAVLVCDEQRRLALQGLFGQIRKARPAPFVNAILPKKCLARSCRGCLAARSR